MVTPSNADAAPVMVARSLARALNEAGVQTRRYYLSEAGGGDADEQQLSLRGAAALPRQHDVIHTHGLRPDLLLAIGSRLGARRERAVWVSTLHCNMDVDLRDLYGSRIAVPAALIWKFALRQTSGQIFLSEAIAQRYGGARPQRVIRNGIEPVLHAAVPDPTVQALIQRARQGHVVFGTLANTRPLKRLDLMIAALAHEPRLFFVHFGEGPQLAELKALAQAQGVSDRCAFLGHRADAACYLPLLHVYVNASLAEASPLSVLEAMRAGVPVVAPRIQPFIEMFGTQAAQLFEGGNAAALAQTVCWAAAQRDGIAQAQAQLFNRDYTAQVMAGKHLRFYSELLDLRAQRSR